ncbi:A-kinase anchor protein 9 [Acipenser ruthenus]|uniref:A-kinase anchor protein 9 n=1 Tax=Acipenser ruthenus TaxID=7906 RepID=A0A662YMX9_ACIRT|nr:A-kinase anchor protein 9 [Acipenser ruthenus]
MDKDERQKKLEAGRAKELTSSLAELDRLEVQECGGQITAMEERFLGKQTALDQLTVEGERLQEELAAQAGTEQLQEIETAVQNHNDIISQLTANLQQAIENRDEVQQEALQLTNQIQALQLQLQQASELLRTKSPGLMELAQTQQHMQVLQMSLKDQSLHLETHEQKAQELEQQLEDSQENAIDKENLLIHMTDKLENTEVQLNKIIDEKEELTQKLDRTISQLHHTLSLRDKEVLELKNEMLALTANQEQHSVGLQHPGTELCHNEELSRKLEEQMEEFQKERLEMEDRLKHLQENLNRAEYQAREALQYKTEKEKLNEDISKLNTIIEELNRKLMDEEEASKHWKAKYQVDISNYNKQLQTLEQEKAEVLSKHDEEIRLLRQQLESQHDDRVVCYKQGIENLKENLNKIKARKDQVNHEATDESQGEEFTLELSGHAEESNILMDKYLASSVNQENSWAEGTLQDQSSNEHSDYYRFELDSEILEQKMSGSTKDDLERSADLTGQSFPDGDADKLRLEPDEGSLQWQKYTLAMHKLDESADAIDMEKAFVIQRCSELSEQLDEKKKELDVLQMEVMSSSEEIQEVQDRWKKVTEELFAVRSELEAEKVERANCEEMIKLKSQKEEDLRNKLSIFEKQNDKNNADKAVAQVKNTSDTGATECLIKELTQEKEFLLRQLQEQEQLVKDVQKQKFTGDSVTSEGQTQFGCQLAALQTQRDQLQTQLEAQKAKNQTTSELLGQKTLLEDSLCKELHLLKTECCEREALLKNLAEEKADLESRLLCIKQNLLNADEARNQNSREKTLLEQNVSELEIKVKNLENILESERQDLGNQLKSKCLDLQKIEVEFKNAEMEYLQKENALKTEVADLKKSIADLVRTHNEAVESFRLKEAEKLDHVVKAAQEELCSCQLEEHHQSEEELESLREQFEERHRHELKTLRSSLSLQHKEELLQVKTDLADRSFSEMQELRTKHSLELEQLRAKLSDNHIEEITKLRLQSAQEAARQVEEEVINRVRSLEEEHHAKLSLMKSEQEHIQQLEERIEQLQEEHAENVKSITAQHKELQKQSIEQVKLNFLEDLKLKLDEAKMEEAEKVAKEYSEKKAKELALLRVQLQSLSEEKLSALREELTSLAEGERQALKEEFGARELEMKRLQAGQEVVIAELEKELKEERNQLQVLQDSLENEQSPQITLLRQKIQAQCDGELATAKATMAEELEQLNINLQEQSEAKLQEAQSRFTKEKEEITEKLTLHQETLLRELKERHAEELEAQSRQLQEQHQKQLSELQQRLQASTETLEQGLKEEHRAQMEALEAELQTNHKTEIQELEARLLSNMDTLESTYLSEVQSIRDEHSQVVQDLKSSFDLTLQKHREDLQREKQEVEATLAQELERLKGEHETELKSSAEELRKELAAIYMEKFKAMAAELEEAHKVELEAALQSQRSVLESEQGKALDVLGAEVLRLEEQHQRAMQELQELHTTEVHRQQDEYSRQLQQERDELKALHQKQQECSSAAASEMEAVQEQLTAQFEEERSRQYRQFQEEIELLKCQSEVLLEQQITQLKEEFEAEKKAALEKQDVESAEKHELSDKNHREMKDKLTAQICEQAAMLTQLKEEVSVLQKEMEEKDSELETILQRRERENEEGGNLVTMLRSDLSRNTEEQKSLQETHERVLKLLLEVAKSTIATEDVISQRIGICMDSSQMLGGENLSVLGAAGQPHRKNSEGQEKGDLHSPASEAATETSLWSALTDEGFELSQRLSDSIFTGPEVEPETEQMILRVCERLRSAVEKLLDLVTESTRQLEQTHGIHVHLEEQFSRQNKETARFVNQHQNLIEQLDEETKAKKQLELELHKAEGLIDGYVAEKAALEEALQRKEKSEQCLVLELETLRGQLHELSEEHSLLVRQREAITANMGDREMGLLVESDLLAKEKLDLQCQAEKDRSNLTSRLKLLETELEEQISQNLELEQRYRLELADLQQQILALEKQLRNDRHFIDEQAVEREHERDEFQIEIKKLEAQLRNPIKSNTGGDYKGQKVETLQATIKEKMDDYNTLLLAKEQYVMDINEQNEEIEKMAARICELEEAALGNAEAAKKVSHLEQELQRMKKMEQDHLQDKEALQQQQYSNRLQISALQSKLDETRHRFPENSSDQVLKEQLEAEREALLNKEKEVEILHDQLDQFQKDLVNKSEEVLQLNMQLEIQVKQSAASIDQVQEESKQLKEKVASLHKQLGVESDESRTSVLQFPQGLMEEKNQEIDHLNEQIFQLQQELKNTNNKVLEEKNVEMEDLRSRIEHLHGDLERLRRDKDEEVEQLHEVIEKLQEELAQLGPNRHEVSDSQDSLERELWQHPSQEDSLQRELASEHLQSSKARLRELEGQLDLACTEKEAVQQLLQKQEVHFRSEAEKLGKDLHNERRQLSILQEESVLLRVSFSQREAMLSTQAQELEDILREREAQLLETEMQVKTLEEQIVAKGAGLEAELSKQQEQCEELHSLKSVLDSQLQDLKQAEIKNQGDIEKLQAEVAKLEARMKDSQVEILTLSSEKTELFSECQAVQLNVEHLQGEVERLEMEVAEKNTLVQELSLQLEDKSARNAEAQKEVLRCAEETLTKAESALKEKEEALRDQQALLPQLKAELSAVKEALSSSTEKTERLLEEGQEKDRSLANLEIHNGSLKSELRKLQEDFTKQEEELSHLKNEVQELRALYGFQAHQQFKEQSNTMKPKERSSQTGPDTQRGFLYNFSNESSLCSPERMRKYDASMEHTHGFHSTHLSELSTLHCTGLDLLHSKSPGLDRDCSEPSDHLTCDGEEHSSHSASASPPFSEGTYSILDSIDTEKAKALENLDLTPPASPACTESTLSVQEWVSDGYRMLKKVYEEGCRVLALSERADPVSLPVTRPLTSTLSDSWLKEKQALQETIQSLKELLSKMVDKGDVEAANGDSDWRRELLQAVRSVFNNERDWLCAELQSHLCSQGSGDMSNLIERLESIVKEQDEQQRVALEQLLSADRSSLLSEIQSLQAQQRISHLQNQEQLQQLQASLTTAEDQASKREHQLRRQVELLEYKLQQEQEIVNDLQSSLRAEQARSTEQRSHLKSEQDAVADLKRELSDTNQELERSLKAQQELQKEIRKLRANLESQEADLCSAVESLEKEQQRVKEIQDVLDQERLKNIQRNDQKGQTHELLQTSLEDRNIQDSQLCSALEQERIANSNLRKELQIEQSRCEALLSQERSRLSEVQRLLEIEKGRTTELNDSLAHKQQCLAQEYKQRLEEEALRREGVAAQEHNFIQLLQAQLDQERERTMELAAMMEKTQQQAIQSKRLLETGVEQSREEAQREHDAASKLRTVLETLQTQKQELERSLEAERQQGTRLQADIEQLQGKIQSVKQKERSREEQRRQDRQALAEKDRRHERDSEKLHEMELQHQRDQLRIKQLQQTLAELEEQERDLSSHKQQQQTDVQGTGRSCSFPKSPDRESSFLHQQHLQFIRQQLQLATLRLKDLVHSSNAGTVDGRSYTEDEDLKFLLRTLTGLDNDLMSLCSSTQRPVHTTSSIAERLLKENADLTTCVAALTEEKIDLKRTIDKLEKELLIHKEREAGSEQVRSHEMVYSVQVSERAAWQKERAFLHSALKKAESELSSVTAEIENRPPAADVSHTKEVHESRELQEGSGVPEEILAAPLGWISGLLRFLVKKWQKAAKKGQIQVVAVNGSTHSEGPGFRTEVLRQHPGVTFNSPPTREAEILHRSAIAHMHQPPKPPYRLHNRSYHSPGPSRSFTSQDSLTDYIHHLEVVQQQLGGLSSASGVGEAQGVGV